ncbi:hypothetical protein EsDP_00004889 [Epichloe bromicola]|uniref:LPXTG-domain-containing protein n=1 Tax=Epichloe bromicola TaxID=79588 RepID=A0ABQ0CT21_9HYPO
MEPIRRALLTFLLFLSRAATVTALQVTPASHCATHCLDSPEGSQFRASDSNTYTDAISCKDIDYSTTDTGIKFRRCMECLQGSSKVEKTESDLKWYIYNLRYTVTTCLFGVPKAPSNGTVASQCNIDKACKSLKAPLTADQLRPNPNTTWDYCTANDGAFMGPGLSSCIDCLQATEGEAYMSNFFTALEVGCWQDPSDGNVLALSGSLFSTAAVNMTTSKEGSNDSSSGSLSPSAVAGIVIGVVVVFVLALALFFLHFRRERARDAAHCHLNCLGPPGWYPYRGPDSANMSQAYRRYYGIAFGDKKSAAAAGSAGEYYDQMETQFRINRYDPYDNGKAGSRLSSTTVNAPDESVGRRGFPRSGGRSTPPRTPSPPPLQRRSNTPDSFAIQQYLHAAEESAKLAKEHPRPPEPVAEPSRARGGIASKFPSFSIPSLSKLRLNRIRTRNPRISLPISTSVAARKEYEMQISGPVNRKDTRFHDRSMGDRIVHAHEQPPSPGPRPQEVVYDGYIEVPLRSGKSTLYGY